MGGAHEPERAAMTVHEIREPGPGAGRDAPRPPLPRLQGAEVGAEDVPAAIDELTLVALLGCFAEGETVVTGAEELRRKESDRIDAVVDGLIGLGAEIEAAPDGFTVRGTGGLRGGRLDSRGDHRMAMLGAVAGLASQRGRRGRGLRGGLGQLPALRAGPALARSADSERALEQDHVEPLAVELPVAHVRADGSEARLTRTASGSPRSRRRPSP